jgi:uncharacterized protein (TIGR02118 family)
MMKLTVLYGHPTSADTFEKYYKASHLPLVAKMKGVARAELTKFVGAPGGGKAAFYRMAELYFANQAEMDKALGSAEGQAAVADLPNFASGGVTVVVGAVDG